MKKALLTFGIVGVAGLIGLASPARADFSLFVGRPGFSFFAGDPVPPPPVYYARPHAYYAPPVYGWPHYRGHHKHHWKHWKKHRGGHHGHHRHHDHDD